MIVVSAYIAAQMLADIASLKIGVVAGLAVDMGTFIYPITFTLRDLAHKVLGRAATRWLIAAAAVVPPLHGRLPDGVRRDAERSRLGTRG